MASSIAGTTIFLPLPSLSSLRLPPFHRQPGPVLSLIDAATMIPFAVPSAVPSPSPLPSTSSASTTAGFPPPTSPAFFFLFLSSTPPHLHSPVFAAVAIHLHRLCSLLSVIAAMSSSASFSSDLVRPARHLLVAALIFPPLVLPLFSRPHRRSYPSPASSYPSPQAVAAKTTQSSTTAAFFLLPHLRQPCRRLPGSCSLRPLLPRPPPPLPYVPRPLPRRRRPPPLPLPYRHPYPQAPYVHVLPHHPPWLLPL